MQTTTEVKCDEEEGGEDTERKKTSVQHMKGVSMSSVLENLISVVVAAGDDSGLPPSARARQRCWRAVILKVIRSPSLPRSSF